MLNSTFLKYGAAPLEGFTVIHMDGNFDSVITLLQGQVTSDCTKLSEQLGQPSSMCDEKGFILCNFDIVLHQKMILVIIEEASKNIFLDEIAKFLPFYKVSASPLNVDLVGICKDSGSAQLAAEYLILRSDIASLLVQINHEEPKENEMQAISQNEWLLNRKILDDHIISANEKGKYRPHELKQNLSRVSFNKGCFKGQEIIARMEYLGKSKKETQLLSYQSPDDILDFIVVGETFQNKNIFFSSCLGKKDFFKKNT